MQIFRAETIVGLASTKATQAERQGQRDKADADVHVAEVRLRVSQADRVWTAAILAYTRIEASYDGVVTRCRFKQRNAARHFAGGNIELLLGT